MNYEAIFDIDYGIPREFGIKYPEKITRRENIVAENSSTAYWHAMVLAERFASEYLSNPKTGLTIVQLSSLSGPAGETVSFDLNNSVVKRGAFDRLLLGF